MNQQQLSTVFTKLSPILGEEVAEAVTHEFARRSGDDLVTKDYLRAELSEQLSAQLRDQSRWLIGWLTGLIMAWGGLIAALVGLSV